MKAATTITGNTFVVREISIHAAREGGDCKRIYTDRRNFISIHAAREGGDGYARASANAAGISIHAAREGGDEQQDNPPTVLPISIHAAREGGDNYDKNICKACKISIHAAREGGDGGCRKMLPPILTFQSTPPVKAATLFIVCVVGIALYFNPRRP